MLLASLERDKPLPAGTFLSSVAVPGAEAPCLAAIKHIVYS